MRSIKPLHELTFAQRLLLTVIIVLVVLFALAAFGWVRDKADAQVGIDAPSVYQGLPFDERLLHLDKQALDEAYHNQLLKLWSVWLADGGKDPTNFTNGLRNARSAYGRAAQQINKREQELIGTQQRQ